VIIALETLLSLLVRINSQRIRAILTVGMHMEIHRAMAVRFAELLGSWKVFQRGCRSRRNHDVFLEFMIPLFETVIS
jgi:hypothetical protein